MKYFFFIIAMTCWIFQSASAQTKYFSKESKISFYSKAPLADIEAHNSKAVSVFDLTTGKIEFSVLMKGFEFEKARMQEDFNENFVESDKYPKAVFTGNIRNPGELTLNKDGTYHAEISGSLTLHGKSKPQIAQATYTVKSGVISALSEFTILLSDYDIKIPAIVAEKIGETARIVVSVPTYQPLVAKS